MAFRLMGVCLHSGYCAIIGVPETQIAPLAPGKVTVSKMGSGQQCVGIGELRVFFNRPLQVFAGKCIVVTVIFVEFVQSMQDMVPGIQAARRFFQRSLDFLFCDRRIDGDRDCSGQHILQIENVGELLIVGMGPDMLGCFAVEKLYVDANAILTASDTALQNIPGIQHLADLVDITRALAMPEGGVAVDDMNDAGIGEPGDQFFGQSIDKIIVFETTADIVER